MSFQYSVIGDNTKENREHLEKFGYRFINLSWDGNYIFTSKKDGEAYYANGSGWDHVDCIGNDPLFQAVTAMRDDMDEDQWFTNGKEWIFCDRQDWIDMYSVLCSGGRYNYNKNGELDKFFKATLAELQEHFK